MAMDGEGMSEAAHLGIFVRKINFYLIIPWAHRAVILPGLKKINLHNIWKPTTN